MRRRRVSSTYKHDSGSFWLSFSDLMSSLVLIIILVLFYIIYQYFALAEVNAREIAEQKAQLEAQQLTLESQQTELEKNQSLLTQAQLSLAAKETELDAAQTELETNQAALTTAQAELKTNQAALATAQAELKTNQTALATAQSTLKAQETELAAQQTALETAQAQLGAQQAALTAAQAELETNQAALTAAQTQLSAKEAEVGAAQSELLSAQTALALAQTKLDSQQTKLDAQQTALEAQQAQLEQLVGIRPRIVASLSEALRAANITATVDAKTGAITMESDVLFEYGRYDLSDRGRSFIDRLLPVYLSVLYSEEYAPYISEIMIEGHTDTSGTYLSNLQLSQQRALAVANYILGDSCQSIATYAKNDLKQKLTVNGRSFSDPIVGRDGFVDMDASRRVVFKFRMTDEQMIYQLQEILEAETGD